jgi:hypothetical protein
MKQRMIEKILDTKEYSCSVMGDTKPDVKLGGAISSKFVPNANMSFSCFSGSEKYFINLNRKDRIVNTELETITDGVLSLRIGDQSDIWQTGENGRLNWDIRFDARPLSNIFEWELLCSPELEFFYQPELTPDEIEMKATRPENVIGSYAVYCGRAGEFIYRDGTVKENYLSGKLLHIYRPLVSDAGGKTCWAELFIDPKQNLLRITIPQEFLDSAVYPVFLDPDFGYSSAGASYSEIFYPYAHDYAAVKYTAGPNETIIKYTAFCATLTAGVLDAAAYTDGPTTRIGTATGIDCGSAVAQWRSSPTISHAMANGTTYCCACGDQSGAPVGFYDVGNAGDTSRDGTAGVLPVTWNQAATHAIRISLYATYLTDITLTVNELIHGHSLDAITLTQVHILSPNDLLHSHSLDAVVLTRAGRACLAFTAQSIAYNFTARSVNYNFTARSVNYNFTAKNH